MEIMAEVEPMKGMQVSDNEAIIYTLSFMKHNFRSPKYQKRSMNPRHRNGERVTHRNAGLYIYFQRLEWWSEN